VDRFDAEKGATVALDKVLLISGDGVKVGSPYVAGAVIKTTVLEEIKGDRS